MSGACRLRRGSPRGEGHRPKGPTASVTDSGECGLGSVHPPESTGLDGVTRSNTARLSAQIHMDRTTKPLVSALLPVKHRDREPSRARSAHTQARHDRPPRHYASCSRREPKRSRSAAALPRVSQPRRRSGEISSRSQQGQKRACQLHDGCGRVDYVALWSNRRHMDFTVMSCEMVARIIGRAARSRWVCLDFVAARPRPRSLAMVREMMLADRIALGARACG